MPALAKQMAEENRRRKRLCLERSYLSFRHNDFCERVSSVNIWGEHIQAHNVSELPVDVASTFLEVSVMMTGTITSGLWQGSPSHQVHILGPNGSDDFWKATESKRKRLGSPNDLKTSHLLKIPLTISP